MWYNTITARNISRAGCRAMNGKKKHTIPKINSVGFGGKWIAAGVVIGAVVPGVLWLFLHRIVWALVIAGGIILAAFAVLLFIELRQDSAAVPYYEKDMTERISFDPETQYAVIRSSICTGEKIAGFKNKSDGHFTEVMLIRSPEDAERFKEMYGLDRIKTEY